jgi:deazaflavin-dependent oxidoreductase (nitroreductase family)
MSGHPGFDGEDFCYLTTRGRVTGAAHTIEIWFAHRDGTVYFLSGGGDGSDWVRNLVADPAVMVQVGTEEVPGRGRVVSDPGEDRVARDLVFSKYQPGYGGDLTEWREESLPVAVDLG